MTDQEPHFTGRLSYGADGLVHGVLVDLLGAEIRFTGERNDAGYYLQQTNGGRSRCYVGEMRRLDGVITGFLTALDAGVIRFQADKTENGYEVRGWRGLAPKWALVPLVDDEVVNNG